MRTLHAYLLRQVISALGMTVAVFTGLLLVGNVLREILSLLVNQHVPFVGVMTAIAMLVPYALVFALPMGMLTATLLVFGRLSADHELTAVRASGVSLLSLVAPVLWLGLAASALAALINLEVAPRCRVGYKELLYELGVARPTSFLVENRYLTDIPGWTIYIGRRRSDTEFEQVLLYETRNDQLVRRVQARQAWVTVDSAARMIQFRLFDAEVFTKAIAFGTDLSPAAPGTNPLSAAESDWSMVFFGETSLPLKFSAAHPMDSRPKISEMTFTQLLAELADNKRRGIDPTPVQVHLHRQVSFSFACLGFTMLGIPLGIRGHRRETSFGIAAGLVLTVIYYSFIILGQSWETRPHLLPHLIVWIPNFLFQGLGAWLLWRGNRGL
ncbi:MAG: hypothetical protein B9S33_00130 [Pedosphaera sp. Tous-C6FEB]|nr:MAG: hypothetical protein B9S33_00130 [Pedosphaera sp. Tous-C6FEB]